MNSHFNTKLTSPAISLSTGYVYLVVLAIVLYWLGFYSTSTFFTWGIPVTFMGKIVNDYLTYSVLLLFFFIHQLINNWINCVVYPWLINCVQDPKAHNLVYSKHISLVLVNLFAVYSELDIVFIISGVMAQLPFFLVLIVANILTESIINWQYIQNKPSLEDRFSLI